MIPKRMTRWMSGRKADIVGVVPIRTGDVLSEAGSFFCPKNYQVAALPSRRAMAKRLCNSQRKKECLIEGQVRPRRTTICPPVIYRCARCVDDANRGTTGSDASESRTASGFVPGSSATRPAFWGTQTSKARATNSFTNAA